MGITPELWANFLDRQLIPVDLRKKRKANQGFEGKKTKLSVSAWLELVFQWNELLSMQKFLNPDDKPFTDGQIKFNFGLEFGSKHKVQKGETKIAPGNSIISGNHSINFKRNEYRRGQLLANQTRSFLMSFKYHTDGNIVTDRSRVRPKYPTFRQCQQICIDFKIGDPRFFTLEELERVHQLTIKDGTVSAWRFPTIAELKNLREMIPVDPYRSVLTYDLHKKENPHQGKSESPLKKLEEERQAIIENDKDELEAKRKATSKVLSTFDRSTLATEWEAE